LSVPSAQHIAEIIHELSLQLTFFDPSFEIPALLPLNLLAEILPPSYALVCLHRQLVHLKLNWHRIVSGEASKAEALPGQIHGFD
jgi:hypothetical protein